MYFCSILFCCWSAHVSNSVFLNSQQLSLLNYYLDFLYIYIDTHTNTHNTFCGCNCGSPWRRDHSDTTPNLWVSARFRHTHTCLFFFLVVLLSDFQRHVSVVHDAQHIKTTKPTTIVLVYKYIPFFQHKVYTFFIRVVFCPVVWHFVETTLVK